MLKNREDGVLIEIVREDDGFVVVKVQPERLDARVAADFKQELSDLVRREDEFVLLDLGQVSFMDSSGLAAIVYAFQVTGLKEQLAICCVQDRVWRLFELTKMGDVVRIFKTREEAVADLQAHPPSQGDEDPMVGN